MFKIPPRLIKKLNEKYKETTVDKFTFTIKKVFKEFLKSDKFNMSLFKGKSEDFKKWVKDNIPDNQRHSFSYIVYYFLLIDEKKTGKLDKKRYREINYYFKNAYNPAGKGEEALQNKETITMDELLELRNKYDQLANEKDNLKDSNTQLGRLLLYLYTEIPPLRSQDYINTIYGDKPNEKGLNYIDLKKGKIHIVSGKSKNSIRVINLTDTLKKIIKITKDRIDTNYLIPRLKNKKEPMSNSNFTHFFNKILGKKISSSKLRNIMASEYFDNGFTSEEKAEIAKIMGHSYNTNQQIYTKYSKALHKSQELINENERLKKEIDLLKNKSKNKTSSNIKNNKNKINLES